MHNASEYRDIRKKIVRKNGRTQYLVKLTVKMQWRRHRVHFKCLSYDIFSLKWYGTRFLYNKQQATGHCLSNNCFLPCPYVCTTQSDRMLICPAYLKIIGTERCWTISLSCCLRWLQFQWGHLHGSRIFSPVITVPLPQTGMGGGRWGCDLEWIPHIHFF